MNGQCASCGATFTGRAGQKFCCRTCRDKASGAKRIKSYRPRQCALPSCRAAFTPWRRDQRFCTTGCGDDARLGKWTSGVMREDHMVEERLELGLRDDPLGELPADLEVLL